MSHRLPFVFAEKILELLPGRNFGHVFFTMCGSTAVDSAMKIALAYHRARGEGSRTRFIGRERGYHGVGFGGSFDATDWLSSACIRCSFIVVWCDFDCTIVPRHIVIMPLGISVGGIMPNRKAFSGALLPNIDHLSHTHSLKDMAFSKGLPTWGTHLADEVQYDSMAIDR